MRAITIVNGALEFRQHPDPVPGDTELLVAVRAAGINAADLLQRAGFYPAPAGSPPDIPGMEFAGEVRAVGRRVSRFAPGDKVMALVGGGGQAEMALVDEACAMAVPDGPSWEEAGGFAEAFCTAYDALFTNCGLSVGERVIVTGAAGGVGTAAVQLVSATGGFAVASVRRAELRDAVRSLGAAEALDPAEATGRGPFHVGLELVGGPGFPAMVSAMGTGGRIAVIGVGAGSSIELDLLAVMQRRLTVRGSTLRTRSIIDKAAVVRAAEAHVVPLLATGRVRVPLAGTVPLERAAEAYEQFATGGKLGKIVLVSAPRR